MSSIEFNIWALRHPNKIAKSTKCPQIRNLPVYAEEGTTVFSEQSGGALQRCFSGFTIGSPTSFSGFRKLLSAGSGQCSFSFWLRSSESMAGDATTSYDSSGLSRSSFVSDSLHTQRCQFSDLLINPGAFGFESFESKF